MGGCCGMGVVLKFFLVFFIMPRVIKKKARMAKKTRALFVAVSKWVENNKLLLPPPPVGVVGAGLPPVLEENGVPEIACFKEIIKPLNKMVFF